ncbi:hypothetical protein AJ79_07957 [Helicocarpus griseus UAMH5409]|uniref:Kinetochore protein Mis14 n=1 Tax=Helicocarpus griseus UAMH5409 TaxID=1447875 RepID=A0A2B7WXK2_9EURO|nr:hypothetical protein AJ79_07957 [Helicocarpus griseus UAMH5409]
MATPHHRKIALQSPADLSYLYTNTLALSRQKLDLHFPPSANASSSSSSPTSPTHTANPDPMKSHVQSLVDAFIQKTFLTAAPSISINGLSPAEAAATATPTGGKNTNKEEADPLSFLHAREAVEYEPYDTALAARVAGLYAQLESLTMTVAQLRRDAPGRAAGGYAEALRGVIEEEELEEEEEEMEMEELEMGEGKGKGSGRGKEDFTLRVPFGQTEGARRRWVEGEVGEVYADALRTLVRLQGEAGKDGVEGEGGEGGEDGDGDDDGDGQRGLATTVGKVERARRAAEVVEHL